jgi:hypothetical protein
LIDVELNIVDDDDDDGCSLKLGRRDETVEANKK